MKFTQLKPLKRNYYFIVTLYRRKGLKPLYIVVDPHNGNLRTIFSKDKATKFESQGLAGIVSTWYWENYWKTKGKSLELESRYVEPIRIRVKKDEEQL